MTDKVTTSLSQLEIWKFTELPQEKHTVGWKWVLNEDQI